MQPPNDPPASAERWVSFDEARMILRMSEGTLRRAIKAGTVEAASFPRNPDNPNDKRSVYRVLVTDPPAADMSSESEHPPAIRQEPPAPADPVVPSLLAKLDERDEMIREKDGEIARLNGELRDEAAGRASAEARADRLQTELDRERRGWLVKLKDALLGE